jgi:hypothetical protein
MSQFDVFIFPNKIWKHRDGTTTDHDFYLGGVPYLRLDGRTLQAVREALRESADDLEASVKAEYGYPDIHPAMKHKFDRDMEPVVKARAALKLMAGRE